MSKPGRNEPCHCGSGKKYKKCCLEKDSASVTWVSDDKQQTEEWEPEDGKAATLNDDEPARDDDEMEDDESETHEEEEEDEDDHDDGDDDDDDQSEEADLKPKKVTDKDYPVISADDEKLVDEWWDALDYEKETEEVRNHLQQFMDTYPQLVENLSLESEVLFELGSKYKKDGNAEEFINFLLYIRKQFPDTYIRSAGFYDSDVIAWLIAENRQGEVEDYLGYLKEHPVEYIEQFFDVVELLTATDNIAPLLSLASAAYKEVTSSNQLLSGNKILEPLISQAMLKYLHPGFTDKDIEDFMDELTAAIAPVEVEKNDTTISYWKTTFTNILKPFEAWPQDIPKKKSQTEDRYTAIGDNFGRYLHERTGISWIASNYYSSRITKYFFENMELAKGKIKKQFDFSATKIEKIVVKLSKDFLWLDTTKAFSILNAVYYFAAYLHECGNINEQEKLTIQNDCRKLADQTSGYQKEFIEVLCFKSFPLFPFTSEAVLRIAE